MPSGSGSLFGGLLRGSGSVLGSLSGLDGPSRSLDRLATVAERAMTLVQRFEDEVGHDRMVALVERAERAMEDLDQLASLIPILTEVRQSMLVIEERVVDVHNRVIPPLDRISLPRPLRRRRRTGGDDPASG